ncbi:voltage-gated shaker-like K+ channel, subunit, partial [Ephemerocybe angulata]
VFPLIGGRKVEHLKDNIEALSIALIPQQIKYIGSVKPFDIGFPGTMVGNGSEISVWMGSVAVIDKQPPAPPRVRPVAEA